MTKTREQRYEEWTGVSPDEVGEEVSRYLMIEYNVRSGNQCCDTYLSLSSAMDAFCDPDNLANGWLFTALVDLDTGRTYRLGREVSRLRYELEEQSEQRIPGRKWVKVIADPLRPPGADSAEEELRAVEVRR